MQLETLKHAIALLALISGHSALAGEQTGTIERIIIRATDNLHYVFLYGTPTNRPSCATTQRYWLVRDENSAAGKSQIALLMAAYASGEPIRIVGTGQCTRWADGEDINVIMTGP
ncbi:MAG: hypothetical protein AAF290_07375 [Pseudomonadota bacterium]